VVNRGHAGVGGNGQAHRFRLTYVNEKHGSAPTHEWSRLSTIEEAERIAKEARAEKDQRAQKLGERSARTTLQKKISVTVSGKTYHGNHDRESINEVTETMTTMQGHGNHDHYLYLGGSSGEGRGLPPDLGLRLSSGMSSLQWSSSHTIWPIEGSYLLSGHRVEMFTKPKHVVRTGWTMFQ
jgi:hypothetical protein